MAFENYALYSHLSVGREPRLSAEGARFSTRRDRGAGQADFRDSRHRAPARGGGRASFPAGSASASRSAVAIIRPADIYLLDEPVGHLDAKLRHKIRAELKALARTWPRLSASPRLRRARHWRRRPASRTQCRQAGAGRQTRHLYHRPANAFVASFVGDPPMSFISVKPRRTTARSISLRRRNAGGLAWRP